jgi:hypothetical protein
MVRFFYTKYLDATIYPERYIRLSDGEVYLKQEYRYLYKEVD